MLWYTSSISSLKARSNLKASPKKAKKIRNRQIIHEKNFENNYIKLAVNNFSTNSGKMFYHMVWIITYYQRQSARSLIKNLKSFIKLYYLIFHIYLMAARSVKNRNTEHLSQIQPRQCTLWLRTNKIIRNLSNKG